MIRVRNLNQGILHIPAAKLRLQGRVVIEVPEVTHEIQKQIDAGRIEIIPDEKSEILEFTDQKLPEPPADFDKLDEADAIEYVEDENDPAVIESILREEVRPSVNDALKARLEEIKNADQ